MQRILAFSGSNHSKSINQQLVKYAASLVTDTEVEVIDIGNWDIPVYSIDMDPDQIPEAISQLIKLIKNHNGFIVSSPEHNGSTPAFLKNIIDWLSRRSKNVFENKPMLLMSTSPGKKGGLANREILEQMLSYQGANITATFSLPSFHQNMQGEVIKGLLREKLRSELNKLLDAMNNQK